MNIHHASQQSLIASFFDAQYVELVGSCYHCDDRSVLLLLALMCRLGAAGVPETTECQLQNSGEHGKFTLDL